MRLTWHIIKKDFVRLRWHIALWALAPLIGSLLLLGAAQRIDLAGPSLTALMGGNMLLLLLGVLVSFSVMLELILGDSLADAHAFWLTRPISPWRLLAAKLLAAALFTFIASLPAALTHAAFATNAWTVFALTFKTAAWGALPVVVLSFAIASVCTSTRQCLLGLFLLMLGAMIWAVSLGLAQHDTALFSARLRLATYLIPATSLAVVLHQFLTRRPRRGLAILLAGTATFFAVTFTWPWHWPVASEPTAQPASSDTTPLTVTVEDSWLFNRTRTRTELALALKTLGLHPTDFIRHIRSHHTWTDSAGHPVATSDLLGDRSGNNNVQTGRALLLPSSTLTQNNRITVSGRIDAPVAATLKHGPLAYRGDYTFSLLRAEIAVEVPIVPGASASDALHTLRVRGIGRKDGHPTIQILEQNPAGDAAASTFITTAVPLRTSEYYALNRKTGDVLSLGDSSAFTSGNSAFSLTVSEFTLRQPGAQDSPSFEVTDAWLHDAVLVKIVYRPVATFTRTIEVPALPIRSDN